MWCCSMKYMHRLPSTGPTAASALPIWTTIKTKLFSARPRAQSEVARVQQEVGLVPGTAGQDMIHFSAIPWLDFTALSHARSFSFRDSCPKISFGKMTEREGRKTMPVSVHGHHGLMDGYHIGLFADRFQQYMTRPAQL